MRRLRNPMTSGSCHWLRYLAPLATMIWLTPSALLADNFLPPGDFTASVPAGWLADVALSHEAADGLPPGSARLEGESEDSVNFLSPCVDLSSVPPGTNLVVRADLQPVNYAVADQPVGATLQIRFYQDQDCDQGWTSSTVFLGAAPAGEWTSLTADNSLLDRIYARAVVGVGQQVPAGGVTLIDNVELDAVGVSAPPSTLEIPAISMPGALLLMTLLGAVAITVLRGRVT